MLRVNFMSMLTALSASNVLAQRRGEEEAACAACGAGIGFFLFVIIGLFVLNVAILVWVAKDAKARNMGSSVGWLILVLFLGPLGLVIYLLSRPKGNLVQCPRCKNKRLESSAACPHCGNA